jgi:Heparinase II/III-like protein/Heparinase II/III N-terminus
MPNPFPWNRYLRRLASMSRHELSDRLRQYLTARADLWRYRWGHDFVKVCGGSAAAHGRFFFTSTEIPALMGELKQIFPAQANQIVLQAEKIYGHRFDLLGFTDLDYGTAIDWHLDVVHAKRAPRKPWFKINYLDFQEVGDSKIVWELNRHQHFVTLAKAYRLTGDEKFASEILAQWNHWHRQNPYPMGINWASSLEVGFRILSWIWTYFLLQNSPIFTTDLQKQWWKALSLSGRHIESFLSTYFSPNTHLIGEGLALFFVGTLFPGLEGATRWQRSGWEILQAEAVTQVREDGFYFEQSTYYHVYALDMFLHARILAALNGTPVSLRFDQILERMLNALLLLGRAGVPPSMGDDDGGRLFDPRRNRAEHMLDPLATGAVLYRRGDFKSLAGGAREETLWLLGTKEVAEFDSLPSVEPSGDSVTLSNSGLFLITEERPRQQLMIDAGPLGARSGGHGHADALGIWLVRNGRNVLIDPGTLEYVGPTNERDRFRGTGAHNTMQVDGGDQADSTGPFSWKTFPTVKVEQWIMGQQFNLFRGSHDGYCSQPSPVIHRRWVFHRKREFWLVRDLAEGTGSHQLNITWHIGPAVDLVTPNQDRVTGEGGTLALLTAEHHGWSQSVREDYWSPAYGRKEPASVVTFEAMAQLPADFATVLISGENLRADIGRLVCLNEFVPGSVHAYRYASRRQEHNFFFAGGPRPWTVGAWSSDADFLYWSFARESDQYMLVLCNGSYVDAGGSRVLNCGRQVNYAEVSRSAEKVHLFSSEPGHVVLEEQSLEQLWADGDLMVPGSDPRRG